MKKLPLILTALLATTFIYSQQYNAASVKALYQKYPSKKSPFCSSCKEWDNPYYKSIADTQRHMPLVTYYVYTKQHKQQQESLNLDRKGIYSAWHPVTGQPNMADIYRQANKQAGIEIALGHCQAWILLAYTQEGAIFSDTYDFNEGMEYQGQNVGTEIATENRCRSLVDQVGEIQIWCGTFGSQRVFNYDGLNVTMPAYYWKILKYGNTIECYWMPNKPEEKQALLPQRVVTLQQLTKNLGFNPMEVLK